MKIPQWYKWAFIENSWLHFHMFAGGVAALICKYFDVGNITSTIIVAVAAIGWEVIEFYIEDQRLVYGTMNRWAWDTFGDIVGAELISVLVILGSMIK